MNIPIVLKRIAVLVFLLFIGANYFFAYAEWRSPIPEELKGFSGTLEGTVTARPAEAEKGFVLRITGIANLWPGNRAVNAIAAVGKDVLINPRWEKSKDSKWHLVESQLKFINSLKIGEQIRIETANYDGVRLFIMELSREQRERIEKTKSTEGQISKDEQAPVTGKQAEKAEPVKTELRVSDGKYQARDGKEWAGRGRIVGKLRNVPSCEIEVYNSDGEPVKSVSVAEKREGFEIGWLEPGIYHFCLDIPGFKSVKKEVEVKAKNDLFIEIELYSNQPAKKAEKKPETRVLPPEFKGFRGSLLGVVVDCQESGFILKVNGIGNIWRVNKAAKPDSTVGQEVLISAWWEKGKEGKRRFNESHLKFIRSLKPKEVIEIDVRNDEGDQLYITELTKQQRERAEKFKPEPEKGKSAGFDTGKGESQPNPEPAKK